MVNNPEYASKEEWDTYAWFGFAIQEAQALERILLIIAVALDFREGSSSPNEDLWFSLYDKFGYLTLRQLQNRIQKHTHFPEDLAHDLEKVVTARNKLAHEFFWPKDLENDERTENAAQTELMAAASLFSNLYPRLEAIMWPLLDIVGVERRVAEDQVATILNFGNDKADNK